MVLHMHVTDPHQIKEWLQSSGIEPKKKFGQNFLLQPEIPLRIAEECGAAAEDAILEIGPGAGTMTQFLAQLYRKVIAVEIDGSLMPVLSRVLAPFPNVTVLQGDIMKTDLRALFNEHFAGMRVSVCANLPYYITTPILMLLLESGLPFSFITVMVQKEVADRLCAPPGSPDYGAVTAAVRYYASAEKLFRVSAGHFSPPPKVDSAVVRLTLHEKPPISVQSKDMLFRVIRAAFAQRRKTLVNALASAFPAFSKENLGAVIGALGLPENIRGERLSLEKFAALADRLTVKSEIFPSDAPVKD